jgi:hypothetical protein
MTHAREQNGAAPPSLPSATARANVRVHLCSFVEPLRRLKKGGQPPQPTQRPTISTPHPHPFAPSSRGVSITSRGAEEAGTRPRRAQIPPLHSHGPSSLFRNPPPLQRDSQPSTLKPKNLSPTHAIPRIKLYRHNAPAPHTTPPKGRRLPTPVDEGLSTRQYPSGGDNPHRRRPSKRGQQPFLRRKCMTQLFLYATPNQIPRA